MKPKTAGYYSQAKSHLFITVPANKKTKAGLWTSEVSAHLERLCAFPGETQFFCLCVKQRRCSLERRTTEKNNSRVPSWSYPKVGEQIGRQVAFGFLAR